MVGALLLAACGGDDDDAAGDTGGDTTTDTGGDTTDDGDDDGGDTGTDGAWDEIVAAAEEEGTVTLYTATPPAVAERIVEHCQTDTGLNVEFLRAASGELLTRIAQERETGSQGADLWITTELNWFRERVAEDALLVPEGPSVEDWPSEHLVDGAIPILSLEPFIIPYNTELVEEPPTGYEDLLKPEFQGNIATTDIVATVLTAWYSWLEDQFGEQYLVDLAAQNPSLLVGAVPLGQAVGAGEVAVSAFGVPTATQPLIDEGAPVAYAVPSPGLGIRYASGIFDWATNPNAAQVLMNCLMSPGLQEVWHGNGESASPLPDIPGSLDPSDVNPWDPDEWPQDRVDEFNARWEGIFRG